MEPKTQPILSDVEPQVLRKLTDDRLEETRDSLERTLNKADVPSLQAAAEAALLDIGREEAWRAKLREDKNGPELIEFHAMDDLPLLELGRQTLLELDGPLNRSARHRFTWLEAEWTFRYADGKFLDAVKGATKANMLAGRLPRTQRVQAGLDEVTAPKRGERKSRRTAKKPR